MSSEYRTYSTVLDINSFLFDKTHFDIGIQQTLYHFRHPEVPIFIFPQPRSLEPATALQKDKKSKSFKAARKNQEFARKLQYIINVLTNFCAKNRVDCQYIKTLNPYEIKNKETLDKLYYLYGDRYDPSNFMSIYIDKSTSADPLFWKYVGVICYLIFPKRPNLFIQFLEQAVKLAKEVRHNMDSAYILGWYFYNKRNWNRSLPLLECAIKNNQGQPFYMESLLLLADIYTGKGEMEKAREYYLIMVDGKFEQGIMAFAYDMGLFKVYLYELKVFCNMKTPTPMITQFVKYRAINSGAPAECDICCHRAPLYYHDCLAHTMCIICYLKTDTCPMCRFNLPDAKMDLKGQNDYDDFYGDDI